MATTQDTTTEHIKPSDNVSYGSVVGMRMWLDGSPLRVAGIWAMLAGFVAAVGLSWETVSLLAVVLALLLADPIWGGLWAQVAGRSVWPGRRLPAHRGWLPYASQTGLGGRAGLPGALVSEVLPLLLVALLVALLVSTVAVWLTILVALLCALGWLARRSNLVAVASWLQALAQVTAPFVLGVSLAHVTPAWPDSAAIMALAGGLTFLARADLAVGTHEPFPLILAVVGSILVAGSAVIAGQPVAAGLLALLAAGPLLLLARPLLTRRSAVQVWWWLLAMTAAVVLGTGIG
jgi:hypothetical protein